MTKSVGYLKRLKEFIDKKVSHTTVAKLVKDMGTVNADKRSRTFNEAYNKCLELLEFMDESGHDFVIVRIKSESFKKKLEAYFEEPVKKPAPNKKVNAPVKKIAKNKKNIPKISTNVTKKATSVTKNKTSVKKSKKSGQTALFGLTPFSELKEEAPAPRFKIGGDIGKLLGDVEIKPIHSVVATLDAPQGAGKTRFLMQVANELAKNYTVLFVSLEEHPRSDLFKAKVNQYLTAETKKRFYPLGELENGYYSLQDIAKGFDVIMIDSWGKATQGQNIDMDKALRKFYNGKLIFPIYQRTQDGKMRGGSEAQFDGDIILKIQKQEDFKQNFVYADKNRYQNGELNEINYNIYHKKIVKR